MTANDLELVSQFCTHSENPFLFTLPDKFCKSDPVCSVLKDPVNITIISVAAALVVLLEIFNTWYYTRGHIAGKFVKLEEEDRKDYMLKISEGSWLRPQMERSLEKDMLARLAGVLPQMEIRKEHVAKTLDSDSL